MSDLALFLNFERSSFIESESMGFTVTLRNETGRSLVLNDFSSENQAVTLVAVQENGTELLGTQLSWKKRNGDRLHEPRDRPTFELGPGDEASLHGDALEWLGTLRKGTYELYAAYNSGPGMYAESERLKVEITQAVPAAYVPEAAPLHPAFALTFAAWQHEEERGRYNLFLLESSPNFPPNFFRNRSVAALDSPYTPVPATAVMDGVPLRHVCWVQGNSVHVLGIETEGGAVQAVKQVPLRMEKPVILESPLSDESGALHLLVADAAGSRIEYIQVPAAGAVRRRDVAVAGLDPDVYAVLWDRQDMGHLLWKVRPGRTLAYVVFSLTDLYAPVELKNLDDVPGVPASVLLAQSYDEDTDVYHDRVFVLSRVDKPEWQWQEWTLELAPVFAARMKSLPVPAGLYRPQEAVLTSEQEPAYLFADDQGAVAAYTDGLEALRPVSDGEQVTMDMQPSLHTTGPFSRKPGLYVGFIRPFEPIQFVAVE